MQGMHVFGLWFRPFPIPVPTATAAIDNKTWDPGMQYSNNGTQPYTVYTYNGSVVEVFFLTSPACVYIQFHSCATKYFVKIRNVFFFFFFFFFFGGGAFNF